MISVAEAAQLLLALGTLVSSLAAFAAALRTGHAVRRTHDLVNGQSELLQSFAEARGVRQGRAEGVREERARSDGGQYP